VQNRDECTGVSGDGPRRPLAGFVGGGFAAGVGDVDGRASGDFFRVVQVAIIQHESLVGRSGRTQGRTDENAPLFGVHSDPQSMAVLPIDLVPVG